MEPSRQRVRQMSETDEGQAPSARAWGDRRACLRLPAFDLKAERIVSVVDDRADLCRVPKRHHQLEFARTETSGVSPGWIRRHAEHSEDG